MSVADEVRKKRSADNLQFRDIIRSSFPPERDTLLDFEHVFNIIEPRGHAYRTADPFPHIVIDDFLPQDSLEAVHAALPTPQEHRELWWDLTTHLPGGHRAQTHKYFLQNILFMRPPVRQLIMELSTAPFLLMLQHMTHINGLLPDPTLWGGGVHAIERDGMLRVHADFRKHPRFGLERRLNLLLYMNPDWKEEYGGHLELWNREMTECRQRVAPIANRCVIFNTEATSYHGHPHPLTCPEGTYRRSIALYYYTPKDVPEKMEWGETAWQFLPGELKGSDGAGEE